MTWKKFTLNVFRGQDFNQYTSAQFHPEPSLQPIHDWFELQGWEPLPFQRRTWEAYLEGRSGLIQVPTGSGKTFAAVMGPIARILQQQPAERGIHLLYITPLRALSRDLALAIREPIEAMKWPIRVGTRNGDSSSSERNEMTPQKNPPTTLIERNIAPPSTARRPKKGAPNAARELSLIHI